MTKSFLLAGTVVLLAGIAPAETWDAVGDFPTSPALPPTNGQWSYGYSNTLGGAFTPDTNSTTDYFGGGSGAVGYYSPLNLVAPDTPGMLPTVLENTTGSPATFGSITNWTPDLLLIHPGQSTTQGEYAIVRFTAPDTQTYNLNAVFQGLDSQGPTSTNVYILVNGVAIYNSSVDSYGVPTDVPESLQLNAGDNIDFAAGFAGSNYNFDSTGFNAEISETPEPGTFGTFGLGSVLAYAILRRGRKTGPVEKPLNNGSITIEREVL